VQWVLKGGHKIPKVCGKEGRESKERKKEKKRKERKHLLNQHIIHLHSNHGGIDIRALNVEFLFFIFQQK